MTRIDGYASEPHFAEHVAAVLAAVPSGSRGRLMCRDDRTAAVAIAAGVDVGPLEREPGYALVAATGDLRVAQAYRKRVALMEHGAGQSYGGSRLYARSTAYAGGTRRDADLFLHPGPHPAGRDRAAYPSTPIEIVGSPILDVLPSREYSTNASRLQTTNASRLETSDGSPTEHPGDPRSPLSVAPRGPRATSAPVIALAFHFEATIGPEGRSAFPWIRDEIARLARAGWTFLGHGHPRAIDRLGAWYAREGIETVRSFADVCRRADVLVADNTSAMFAFAAKGGRVVVLNPPWYRRDVDHGLRFWPAATVGIGVDDPAELEASLVATLDGSAELDERREAALELVYAYRSGAARRAADVLAGWAA